jgi:molecular chaperone Hsp33
MKDYLVRGLVNKYNCRIFACTTTNLVNVAREKHGLWPCASAALGRTMSVTLMMGAMSKTQDKLTVSLNGGGPIGTVLCTTHSDGKIKGFVGDPHVHYVYNDSGKLAVGMCVGTNGYLQVIRDMGLKEPITSQVPLQTGEIGDDFAYYFMASEQVPSVVDVGVLVGQDTVVKSAGGFIIQLLPEATDENITFIENKMKDFPAVSKLLDEGKTPEEIMQMIFGDDVEFLGSQDLAFECDCSKEKFSGALTTIPDDQLDEMIKEDHGADITCQFCGKHYHFTEDDLKEIKANKRA